jgi:hypothetical protein
MNKIAALLVVSVTMGSPSVFSQKKLSLSVSLGSGISCFRGSGTVENSVYYRNGQPFPNSIDTIAKSFGRKAHTNYLAGLQADWRLHSKWILSLSTHFESSGGRLHGDSVITSSSAFKTDGEYRRYYHYISFNPQIARILFQKSITVLVHAGIDYTSKLDQGVSFEYTSPDQKKWFIGGQGNEPEVNDARVTAGATIIRKKWGLDINYKHGFVDYLKYSPDEAYSRMLHIRLLYHLMGR